MSTLTTKIAPSLGSGSSKAYLVAQVRMMDGKFHVQVLAPNEKDKNRNYGYAFDFEPTSEVANTIVRLIKEATT